MNMNLTELVFILDESGSMRSLAKDTIGGFNTLIEKQLKEEGECRVSLVLFNDKIRKVLDHVDIKEVEPLTDKTFFPLGTTAMLDAIGSAIDSVGKRLADTPEEERPGKVVVIIMTDGYENSSTEYSMNQINEMISLQQNTYNWTFMFLGSNIDAEKIGKSYGIRGGYSKTYSACAQSVATTYGAISKGVSALRKKGLSSQEVDTEIKTALNEIQ